MKKQTLLDKERNYNNNFKSSTCHACIQDPSFCCFACICPCYAQYILRKKALNGNLNHYSCTQGYQSCTPCLMSNKCGESKNPALCLFLESFLCCGTAVKSNLLLIRDQQNLKVTVTDMYTLDALYCTSCCLAARMNIQLNENNPRHAPKSDVIKRI